MILSPLYKGDRTLYFGFHEIQNGRAGFDWGRANVTIAGKELAMNEQNIARINLSSFVAGLITIALGVAIGILGVWGTIPTENGMLWKLLATDGIVFGGAVMTNLAIACYRKPGGAVA